MIRITVLILMLFITQYIRSQTLSGRVIDATTKQSIAYGTIYVPELNVGAAADSGGYFHIQKLPQKLLAVRFSAVGYETRFITVKVPLDTVVLLTPSHIQMEEMVVSVPAGTLNKENIAPVEQRSISELRETGINNLSDAISTIPGVQQVATGPGIGKPSIRGLSGNRVLTYSQGVRLENQQWGAEHGLGTGMEGIERLEVIKGPASLLYGSDALGGVLYLVEEKYAHQNTLEGKVTGGGYSNSGYFTNGGIKVSGTRWRLNLFSGLHYFNDYKQGNAETVPNSRYEKRNIKGALGYYNNHIISNVRFSWNENDMGITTAPDASLELTKTTHSPSDPYQYTLHRMITTDNTFLIRDSRLIVTLGYQFNTRKEFEDEDADSLHHHAEENTDEAANHLELSTYTWEAKYITGENKGKWNTIVGTQGMHQDNRNFAVERIIPNAQIFDAGFFFNTSRVFKIGLVQAGLRYDFRKLYGNETGNPLGEGYFPLLQRQFHAVNGALAFRHDFTRPLTLRINLATGYRAPNLSELLSNGIHHGSQRYEIGNANLKNENNFQADVKLNFTSEHFSVFVNPFFNFISNFIYLARQDSLIEGFQVYAYQQQTAFITGGETGFHWHPHPLDILHFESAVSTLYAADKTGAPLPLIPANRIRNTLRITWKKDQHASSFCVFITHLYYARQGRFAANETGTKDYHIVNAGLTGRLKTGAQLITISAGVKNLLNTNYAGHLFRYKYLNILQPGRNFYVQATIPFAFKLKGNPGN